MLRNKKGQFIPGDKKESLEERRYRFAKMKESWKNRANYIRDIKDPKLYNIWRSFRFSKKGKKAGNCKEWNSYRTFYNEMFPSYEPGKRLVRLDKTKPFSKINCVWATEEQAANLNSNVVLIEYKGEKRTIKEWAYLLNKSPSAIKDRYYKYKNVISIEEILLGRKSLPRKKSSLLMNYQGRREGIKLLE